ncbi:MAG: Fic family protein [Deltaproteobacteria bacterium]|jgi:Fic family protein|nr:Fic family protein [Deltaproteobacteria bacterium]
MFEDKLSKLDNFKTQLSKFKVFDDEQLVKSIENYYHVRLTYTSNTIEGFNYTQQETHDLIFKGKVAESRTILETGAVRGHDSCFDYMMDLQTESYLDEQDILKFHKLLAGGLENQAIAGRYRDRFVKVGDYVFLPPDRVKGAMKNMFDLLDKSREKMHPVILAIRYHKDLLFIHPFMDGNGRVARLAMNTVMLQNNYLPIDIPPDKILQYQSSIAQSYRDSFVFYDFMLDSAIDTHEHMIYEIERQIDKYQMDNNFFKLAAGWVAFRASRVYPPR